jgi:hypothetical protein
MRSIVYVLWSVGNCIGATQKEEKEEPTSCPAKRKTNMFPGRAGQTLSKNA